MAAIEIHSAWSLPIDWGDGTMPIACHDNLQNVVKAIATHSQPNSIDVLRITSPGIIAILIGLLLPAVQKVREAASRSGKSTSAFSKLQEAAGHNLGTSSSKSPTNNHETGEILPYIEQNLHLLRPFFAHEAHVELRVANVAVGDINTDGLKMLASAFGVPVWIGRAAPNIPNWQGPVIKVSPEGTIHGN